MPLPDNPSESFKRLNPNLYPSRPKVVPTDPQFYEDHGSPPAQSKPRLRQSSKPVMNKLETEFREVLRREYPNSLIHEQAITFKLANGLRYTPDVVVFLPFCGLVDAYEVKGFMRDDAAVKIKVAATAYPHIKWVLAWKENGSWQRQVIR